ncbi:MAG: universal stress protein [Magnetococcales bacterium]|nr:universal stress protein [Magnetococcales bacterium]
MLKDPPNHPFSHSDETFSPASKPCFLSEDQPKGPIMIPIDFSLDSVEAVKQGYALSTLVKEPIYLLHVIPKLEEKPNHGKNKKAGKKFRRQRDRAADQMARFLRQNNIPAAFEKVGIKYYTTLARGEPLTAILEAAQKVKAGLIILGCGRNSGPSSHLLGTTTERVLRLAQRPVMVVKHQLDR